MSWLASQLCRLTSSHLCGVTSSPLVWTRSQHTAWSTLKDMKRRRCVKEHGPTKLRVNVMRKNAILPPFIQELSDKAIDANFPRDSRWLQIVPRCVITSRGRGVIYRWRLSRFVFRHLADYNRLSGVIRAKW